MNGRLFFGASPVVSSRKETSSFNNRTIPFNEVLCCPHYFFGNVQSPVLRIRVASCGEGRAHRRLTTPLRSPEVRQSIVKSQLSHGELLVPRGATNHKILFKLVDTVIDGIAVAYFLVCSGQVFSAYVTPYRSRRAGRKC